MAKNARSSTRESGRRCRRRGKLGDFSRKNQRNQESRRGEEKRRQRTRRRSFATAKSDSRCRHGGRWILLAGASHVKQLFVYLSYPAVQLSSAISGTRSSSSSRAVTTRTPCAWTSAPASAPGSRITVKEQPSVTTLGGRHRFVRARRFVKSFQSGAVENSRADEISRFLRSRLSRYAEVGISRMTRSSARDPANRPAFVAGDSRVEIIRRAGRPVLSEHRVLVQQWARTFPRRRRNNRRLFNRLSRTIHGGMRGRSVKALPSAERRWIVTRIAGAHFRERYSERQLGLTLRAGTPSSFPRRYFATVYFRYLRLLNSRVIFHTRAFSRTRREVTGGITFRFLRPPVGIFERSRTIARA